MKTKAFLGAWLFIGLFTFGWAAAEPGRSCAPDDDILCLRVIAMDRAFAGTFAGLLWPLYWSWEIAEQLREPGHEG